jgi:hypothetical protein
MNLGVGKVLIILFRFVELWQYLCRTQCLRPALDMQSGCIYSAECYGLCYRVLYASDYAIAVGISYSKFSDVMLRSFIRYIPKLVTLACFSQLDRYRLATLLRLLVFSIDLWTQLCALTIVNFHVFFQLHRNMSFSSIEVIVNKFMADNSVFIFLADNSVVKVKCCDKK